MTAVLVLKASSIQMGLLGALSGQSYLIASLPVGFMVDRMKRRPIMITMDLARAILIGLIPVLTFLHQLNFVCLYVVALTTGYTDGGIYGYFHHGFVVMTSHYASKIS